MAVIDRKSRNAETEMNSRLVVLRGRFISLDSGSDGLIVLLNVAAEFAPGRWFTIDATTATKQ